MSSTRAGGMDAAGGEMLSYHPPTITRIGDGVQDTSPRFDTFAERTLSNIDDSFAHSGENTDIEELKQQNHLLRDSYLDNNPYLPLPLVSASSVSDRANLAPATEISDANTGAAGWEIPLSRSYSYQNHESRAPELGSTDTRAPWAEQHAEEKITMSRSSAYQNHEPQPSAPSDMQPPWITPSGYPLYKRPNSLKLSCDQCDEHPDGFRGEHELRRHRDLKHSKDYKRFVCRTPAQLGLSSELVPITPLDKCKHCVSNKEYGQYYNAAAHLRRAHFKAMPSRASRTKTNVNTTVNEVPHQNQGGMSAGADWPPMAELKKKWMEEIQSAKPYGVSDGIGGDGGGDSSGYPMSSIAASRALTGNNTGNEHLPPPVDIYNFEAQHGASSAGASTAYPSIFSDPRHQGTSASSVPSLPLEYQPDLCQESAGKSLSTTSGSGIKEDFNEPDDGSVYSAETTDSTRPDRELYEHELSLDLFNYVSLLSEDRKFLSGISELLPHYLQAFARKLGAEGLPRVYRDIMRFTIKHRKEISSHFQQYISKEDEDDDSVASEVIPGEEKVNEWLNGVTDDLVDPSFELHDRWEGFPYDFMLQEEGEHDFDGDDDLIQELPANLKEFRQTITNSSAYAWLRSKLHSAVLFDVPGGGVSLSIANAIYSHPVLRIVSRRAPPPPVEVLFVVEWDLLGFLQDQEYGVPPADALEKALTLTGNFHEAEGLACGEYISRMWPRSRFLSCLKFIVTSAEQNKTCPFIDVDGTILKWLMQDSKLSLTVTGPPDIATEIGEQLVWLSCALRPSNSPESISLCTPSIKTIRPAASGATAMTIEIHCNLEDMNSDVVNNNGVCWVQLLRNPTVVSTYPIVRRTQSKTGLALDITTLLALVQSKRITPFKNKVFIKGFSTLLVATRKIEDTVFWHALVMEDGSCIRYHDPRVSKIHTEIECLKCINVDGLVSENVRHVVGWWSKVKDSAGTAEANFDIKNGTRCQRPDETRIAVEKITVGVSKIVSANATVALGKRDRPARLATHKEYVDQLCQVSNEYIVLYDTDECRAWLLDGATAMLHLLRASLVLDEKEGMRLIHTHHDLPTSDSRGKLSSRGILMASMNTKLYSLGMNEEGKEAWYHVKDRIDRIYSVMDEIFNHYSDVSNPDGLGFRIRVSSRRQLDGFDFREVASSRRPLFPRVATLNHNGKSWVDLIRELRAVTFFGRGFGELLQPLALQDSQQICTPWATVPIGRDYLSLSSKTLRKIIDEQGDDTSKPVRMAGDVYLQGPQHIFEPCDCTSRRSFANGQPVTICERAHVSVPHDFLRQRGLISMSRTSATLPAEGAVILGYNKMWPLRWPDRGGPEGGSPEPELDERLLGPLVSSAETSTVSSVRTPSLGGSTGASSVTPALSGPVVTPLLLPERLSKRSREQVGESDDRSWTQKLRSKRKKT